MKNIINVWDVISFSMNKWDERYGKEITWIVQVVVKQSFWTYFMIWDWTQYYIDWIDDLIVLNPKEQKQRKFTKKYIHDQKPNQWVSYSIINFLREHWLLSSDE